jgi:SAM-dependent methyltransferase
MELRRLLSRDPIEIRDGVFDFIGDGDYCENFGDQWNRFRTIQIDSVAGHSESAERFLAETGWTPEWLRGKVLLDAGCGAGRFAEIALSFGARVVAVDLSTAAWACYRTIKRFPERDRLVIRANLFDLPLIPGSFDGIYSLGVLQHTPDPLRALRSLIPFLKPNGRLAVWIYEKLAPDVRWLQPRTYLRAAISKWPVPAKLAAARVLTTAFFPFGWVLSWLGRNGERAAHFLPYAARHHLRRGSLRAQWDYSVMDTFDWYGPVYDIPQREQDVIKELREAGLTNVRRLDARGMAIVAEASQPARSGTLV